MSKAFLFSLALIFMQGGSDAAPTPPPESQAKAVQKYPALGVDGSDFQHRFVSASEQRETTHPAFFKNHDWPLTLADELASGDAGPGPEFLTMDVLRWWAPVLACVAIMTTALSHWFRKRRLRRHQGEREKLLTPVDF